MDDGNNSNNIDIFEQYKSHQLGENDVETFTHYTNLRRLTRIFSPPKRFSANLTMQFLIGYAADPT